jgi:hypothetical protein
MIAARMDDLLNDGLSYYLPLLVWSSTPMFLLVLSASSAPRPYRGPCSHPYRSHLSQLRSSDHIAISPPSFCTYFSQPRPAIIHLDFIPQLLYFLVDAMLFTAFRREPASGSRGFGLKGNGCRSPGISRVAREYSMPANPAIQY